MGRFGGQRGGMQTPQRDPAGAERAEPGAPARPRSATPNLRASADGKAAGEDMGPQGHAREETPGTPPLG